MKILTSAVLLGLGLLLTGASETQAQLPFSNLPPPRPTVSPYLNLLGQQSPGVSNYFTLVRPQIDQRNEQLRQQREIQQLQRQSLTQRTGGVPVSGSREIRGTGHESVFMNYSHYYPQRR